MNYNTDHSLKREDVHNISLDLLLQLVNHEKRELFSVIFSMLLYAASRKTSLHRASMELKDAPSGNTLRNHLAEEFSDMEQAEKMMNEILQQRIPKSIAKKKRRRVSVDLHQQPYYGSIGEDDQEEVRRGENKKGTNNYFVYATAYFSHKGVRYTLALTHVQAGETMDVVLKRLMRILLQIDLNPNLLLLDREFYTTPVMRYLIRRRLPFIIPAKKSGRGVDHPDGPSGMYVYGLQPKGWYRYILNKKQNKKGKRRPLIVDIAVVHVQRKTKKGELKRGLYVYATWGLKHRSPDWVKETYRKRFGIETSYRQGNQARVKTCTRNPALRLIFFFTSQLLRQVWVWLHHEVIAVRRRGGRILQLNLLTLETLLTWLKSLLEELYHLITEITVSQDVRKSISEVKPSIGSG